MGAAGAGRGENPRARVVLPVWEGLPGPAALMTSWQCWFPRASSSPGDCRLSLLCTHHQLHKQAGHGSVHWWCISLPFTLCMFPLRTHNVIHSVVTAGTGSDLYVTYTTAAAGKRLKKGSSQCRRCSTLGLQGSIFARSRSRSLAPAEDVQPMGKIPRFSLSKVKKKKCAGHSKPSRTRGIGPSKERAHASGHEDLS